MATDYVTKWAQTKTTRKDDKHVVAKFLREMILLRYGCPKELVNDRGTHFVNDVIKELKKTIKLNIDSLHHITHELMVRLKKIIGFCARSLQRLSKIL